MSIANLLSPNNLDIQCNNLTCNTMDCGSIVVSGVDTPGELILTGGLGVDITATTGTTNINGNTIIRATQPDSLLVNNTSNTFSNELRIQNNGLTTVGFGNNNTTNEAYVWTYANQPLKFATNGTERLRIPSTGIALDNTSTNLLATNGVAGNTTISYVNDLITNSSTGTFTNKTIDSSTNTLTITNSPLSATNINTVLDQPLLISSSPSFDGLSMTSLSLDNTCTNVLAQNGTAGPSVVAYVNNLVNTTSSQTLNNKNLVDATTSIVNYLDSTKKLVISTGAQFTGTITTIESTSTTNKTIILPNATDTLVGRSTTDTLANKTIDSSTNTLTITNSPLSASNVNTLLNQAVLTTSSPTFSSINTTLGESLWGGTVYDYSGTATITTTGETTIYTLAIPQNISILVNYTISGFCTSGVHATAQFTQNTWNRSKNISGTVTNVLYGSSVSFDGSLAGVVGQNVTTSGTNTLFQITGFTTDTWVWLYYLKVYYM